MGTPMCSRQTLRKATDDFLTRTGFDRSTWQWGATSSQLVMVIGGQARFVHLYTRMLRHVWALEMGMLASIALDRSAGSPKPLLVDVSQKSMLGGKLSHSDSAEKRQLGRWPWNETTVVSQIWYFCNRQIQPPTFVLVL